MRSPPAAVISICLTAGAACGRVNFDTLDDASRHPAGTASGADASVETTSQAPSNSTAATDVDTPLVKVSDAMAGVGSAGLPDASPTRIDAAGTLATVNATVTDSAPSGGGQLDAAVAEPTGTLATSGEPFPDAGLGATASDAGLTSSDAAGDSASIEPIGNPNSCKEALSRAGTTDGVYEIDVDGTGSIPATAVYCDMTFDGGGWTLIQSYSGAESPDDFPADDGVTLFLGAAPRPSMLGAFGRSLLAPLLPAVTQVHIRSSFVVAPGNADATTGYWVTSRAPVGTEVTPPIANLRAYRTLNDASGGDTSDWNGPRVANLAWTPSTLCDFSSRGYPALYWACNNEQGLHIVGDRTRWVYLAASDDPIEVYVR